MLEERPENYKLTNLEMTNCGHKIDEGLEDKLKSGEFYADYSAWEFWAEVWWNGKQFVCQIDRYKNHINTIYANTLKEIMEQASELYGYA